MAGISSRLRSRVKPGRVSLEPLETTRASQLLSTDLWAAESLCPPGPSSYAQANHPGHWLLGAGRTILSHYIMRNSIVAAAEVSHEESIPSLLSSNPGPAREQ